MGVSQQAVMELCVYLSLLLGQCVLTAQSGKWTGFWIYREVDEELCADFSCEIYSAVHLVTHFCL